MGKYEREKSEDMRRWKRYRLTGIAIDHDLVEKWLKKLSSGR
jgi:hypothetical protein